MAQRSRLSLPRAAVLPVLAALLAGPLLGEVSLTPTRAGLLRQSEGAQAAGFTYLLSDAQVHDAVRRGDLVTVPGNADYYIHPDVRHAAARPEVKIFLERLAAQYHATCGEKLIVTSLVRPRDHQPWNSDPLSVHPTGMAVDMRVSTTWSCRRWLESTLLDLEAQGVVEAARERMVPHFHVVVFPGPYRQLLARSGVAMPATEAPGAALDAVLARLDGPDPFLAPTGLVAAAVLAGGAGEAPVSSTTVAAVSRGEAPPAVTAVSRSSSRSRHEASTSARHSASRAKSKSARSTSSRHSGSHAKKTPSSARYKVRNGDTLWTIAQRHGTTVASIQRANRVSRGIKPGQVLVVPLR